jgi:hypothetical protein
MKRAMWPVFVPLLIMLTISAVNNYGLIAVMAWTGIGGIALKLTDARLTSCGQGVLWQTGWRKVVMVSNHLFWWPWHLKRIPGKTKPNIE